jgi:hypothetical protein
MLDWPRSIVSHHPGGFILLALALYVVNALIDFLPPPAAMGSVAYRFLHTFLVTLFRPLRNLAARWREKRKVS